MIRLNDVHSGYPGREVLRGVSLCFEPGEMVGILGPNGSGKTTLLLTLSGVLPVSQGRIEIDGRELRDLPARDIAKRMASVPQRIESAFDLKVESLVLMGRYPYVSFWGGYGPEDEAIALEAMTRTRTEAFRDRLTGRLSGGEFQRVLIARALAQETGVLLLDEAASGLDIARKIEIYDLLAEKNREGVTILSVIHDLNLAALYCRRLVFLKDGKIALDGGVREIFTEENLSFVYESNIKVGPHPVTGAPQAHLVPGRPDRPRGDH